MRTKLNFYRQKIADMVCEELISTQISQSFRCNVCNEIHHLQPGKSLEQLVLEHRRYYIKIFEQYPEDCSFWNFYVVALYEPVLQILRKRGVCNDIDEPLELELLTDNLIIKIWREELWDSISKYKMQFDTRSEAFRWFESYDRCPHFMARHMVFGRNQSESKNIAANWYSIPTKLKKSDWSKRLCCKAEFDKEDNVIIALRGLYAIEPPGSMIYTVKIPICKFNITTDSADIQQMEITFNEYISLLRTKNW
jgi:hypothetical protein